MARRSLGMPRDTEYPWVSDRCTVSTSLATMCGGVGPSGLPMPKSMMSSPRRRAAIFNSEVIEKMYGGRRVNRAKSFSGADIGSPSSVSARNRPSDVEVVARRTREEGREKATTTIYNRNESARLSQFITSRGRAVLARFATMKLHLQTPVSNVVTAFGAGWVRVGVDEYRENIVLLPDA